MTVAQQTIPRTAAAVRDWLARNAAADVERFDEQFHQALHEAGRTYDLTSVETVVGTWWAIVWGRHQQLTDDERAQLRRADDGDLQGLHIQHPDGTFTRLG